LCGKGAPQVLKKNINKPIETTTELKVMSGVRNADQRCRRCRRFVSSRSSEGGG
jgi:hypothetical protein